MLISSKLLVSHSGFCHYSVSVLLHITHMEMIKGIEGHGYYDELVVPIIENTAYENELTDSLSKAVNFYPSAILYALPIVEAYPKTTAELVWNHGINVRGDTWISAKTQVCAEEGLNYLILCCSSHGCLEQITTSLWCGSDTKQEHEGDKTSSYIQMSESLGVDSPSEILFLTDVLQEAVAAAGKKKGSKLSMLEKTSIPNARRRLCQRIMGSRSINSFWKI
ncbi:Probable bifunctional methylthioribulose-1-phosphate dehydratase/enolase-phosphatase E1 [Linum perenne]